MRGEGPQDGQASAHEKAARDALEARERSAPAGNVETRAVAAVDALDGRRRARREGELERDEERTEKEEVDAKSNRVTCSHVRSWEGRAGWRWFFSFPAVPSSHRLTQTFPCPPHLSPPLPPLPARFPWVCNRATDLEVPGAVLHPDGLDKDDSAAHPRVARSGAVAQP